MQKEERNRPTSFDVAARAGVSQSTVSRALRGDSSIPLPTRERIAAVARELDYRPDQRAARLRTRTSGAIAVLLLGGDDVEPNSVNLFLYALVGAVSAAAARKGLNALVAVQTDLADVRLDFARSREADGMIVIGSARQTAAWARVRQAHQAGERLVCWGAPDDVLPTVRCDNRGGGRCAAEHLLAAGRRAIAFVGPGWDRQKAFRDRRQGYADALAAAGLPTIESDIGDGLSREEQGYRGVLQLLDAGRRFDALFAASDLIAFGALRALRERGIAVPQDVAVVGFDGIQSTLHVTPSLTTIKQDLESAGTALVERLLSGEAGAEVDYRLAVRESCGSA
ncbi:LacI family transcriptional regulator [Sphingomonas ginkgonis]|uniref:LacI family transcriptional regulator n=1 Tax=Sphingomonas ginkgonis TaxID=2315330 RepID=A0A3R9WR07_9SPHN|nr:substrate-binding domain-containing protein [Sphingomonas ginkgonis]RST29715.1 LacI family transcriptional regulator [Sphingomonas ginkgonis]